ncbi:hypothetical protein A3709_20145 [Halioglobus sp. HI00S01]|nr:hypothetical protein A3709_20145 [Halioglobus sp. HI00S01]
MLASILLSLLSASTANAEDDLLHAHLTPRIEIHNSGFSHVPLYIADRVEAVAVDTHGNMYAGTSRGVQVITPSGERRHFDEPAAEIKDIRLNPVSDTVWFAHSKGVAVFDRARMDFVDLGNTDFRDYSIESEAPRPIYRLEVAKSGNTYFITEDQLPKLIKVSADGLDSEQISVSGPLGEAHADWEPTFIGIGRSETYLLIAELSGEMYRVNLDDNNEAVSEKFTAPCDLVAYGIQSGDMAYLICRDFPPGLKPVHKIASFNAVTGDWSVFEAPPGVGFSGRANFGPSGELIVAGENSDVFKFDPANNFEYERYDLDPGGVDVEVTNVASDRFGRIWATRDSDLSYLTTSDTISKIRYPASQRKPGSTTATSYVDGSLVVYDSDGRWEFDDFEQQGKTSSHFTRYKKLSREADCDSPATKNKANKTFMEVCRVDGDIGSHASALAGVYVFDDRYLYTYYNDYPAFVVRNKTNGEQVRIKLKVNVSEGLDGETLEDPEIVDIVGLTGILRIEQDRYLASLYPRGVVELKFDSGGVIPEITLLSPTAYTLGIHSYRGAYIWVADAGIEIFREVGGEYVSEVVDNPDRAKIAWEENKGSALDQFGNLYVAHGHDVIKLDFHYDEGRKIWRYSTESLADTMRLMGSVWTVAVRGTDLIVASSGRITAMSIPTGQIKTFGELQGVPRKEFVSAAKTYTEKSLVLPMEGETILVGPIDYESDPGYKHIEADIGSIEISGVEVPKAKMSVDENGDYLLQLDSSYARGEILHVAFQADDYLSFHAGTHSVLYTDIQQETTPQSNAGNEFILVLSEAMEGTSHELAYEFKPSVTHWTRQSQEQPWNKPLVRKLNIVIDKPWNKVDLGSGPFNLIPILSLLLGGFLLAVLFFWGQRQKAEQNLKIKEAISHERLANEKTRTQEQQHRMGNLLNTTMSKIHMLASNAGKNKEDSLNDLGHHLKRLVKMNSTLAKDKELDMATLIEDVVSDVIYLYAKTGYKVTTKVDIDQYRPGFKHGDIIGQIVSELIVNTCKHCRTEECEITISARESESHLTLEYEDTAGGIPERAIAQAYEDMKKPAMFDGGLNQVLRLASELKVEAEAEITNTGKGMRFNATFILRR